jgi:predicted nucleotide-binding protein (sugar kinase/HSP70/actin superfamily)
VEKQPRFRAPARFEDTRKLVRGYVGYGNKMGEGWLLTAEMLELIHSGCGGVVCTQPFGCLPNHVSGKGMMGLIKRRHPDANIVAIDYDPGASRTNQENRIKLMLAAARTAHETKARIG